jgi:hypothetical protein
MPSPDEKYERGMEVSVVLMAAVVRCGNDLAREWAFSSR